MIHIIGTMCAVAAVFIISELIGGWLHGIVIRRIIREELTRKQRGQTYDMET